LHVDHGLQRDAKKMARAARAAATTFETAHHSELRIPWGEPPFPSRPRPASSEGEGEGEGEGGTGESVESVARIARYQLMFDEMVARGPDDVRVLATGHHADDQVETVLMRLGAGSSALGLGGMRRVRRFGMALGGRREGDFGWFGHLGLERWIVRPLLDVSKVSQLRSVTPPLFLVLFWVGE
jgi:tRNA(Ile)-lysidine synthase TilS/MesJ